MNGLEPTNQLDERTRRQLAGLADGSLGGRERAELETRVAESPVLRTALARQRAGMAVLRELELSPPPALRTRIEAQRSGRRRRSRTRAWTAPRALAVGVAAVALLAIALLPSSSGDPTVVEASRLTTRPATESIAVAPSNPKLLAASVEGVPFPSWTKEFGWRQTGTRADRLDGRASRTVFYERNGRRIAYTIVSGDGIHAPAG